MSPSTSMHPAYQVSLTILTYSPSQLIIRENMFNYYFFQKSIHLGLHCQWLYIKQDSALIKQIADHLKEFFFSFLSNLLTFKSYLCRVVLIIKSLKILFWLSEIFVLLWQVL